MDFVAFINISLGQDWLNNVYTVTIFLSISLSVHSSSVERWIQKCPSKLLRCREMQREGTFLSRMSVPMLMTATCYWKKWFLTALPPTTPVHKCPASRASTLLHLPTVDRSIVGFPRVLRPCGEALCRVTTGPPSTAETWTQAGVRASTEDQESNRR